MLNYLKKMSLSGFMVILLAIFTMLNSDAGFDILSFLIIIFIILQKIFDEYFILILLAVRPAMDYWRDVALFSFKSFDFNINAALSVLLLIWTIYFFIKNRRYFNQIPVKIPWIVFLAWISITVIYSYDRASTVRDVIKAANLFDLFGICYIMSAKNHANFNKYFTKALIAASVVPLATALYQFFSKTGVDIDGVTNRIYGTFAHPNIMATYALLLLMVLAEKNFGANKNGGAPLAFLWQKKFFGAGLFLLITIALTYTRIAWVGAAAFFLITGAVYYKKIVICALSAAILFFALFYPVNNYLINNYNINLQSVNLISRLTSRNEDSDSIKWRIDVAGKVLPLFKKNPVFGYGWGSFPKVWDDNKDIRNIWDTTSEAHNDYIKVAFESGIIGFILFLWIFISLLYKQVTFGAKNHWINIVFIASIVIYSILSISDNMLRHTSMIWWLWAVWGLWSNKYQNKFYNK